MVRSSSPNLNIAHFNLLRTGTENVKYLKSSTYVSSTEGAKKQEMTEYC